MYSEGGNIPLQKYTAWAMQRVVIIRNITLKYGSSGRTARSRLSARALPLVTSILKP